MNCTEPKSSLNILKTKTREGIEYFEDDSRQVANLYSRLLDQGAELSIDAEGRLAIDAPAGLLTDELVAQVRAHRDELVALVGGPTDEPTAGPEPVAWGPACVCPFCLSGDRLADDPEGLRCVRCDRLAFLFEGESIVRADWVEPRLIDAPELVVLDSPGRGLSSPTKRAPVVAPAKRSLFDPAAES